jgi:hypothetical protein
MWICPAGANATCYLSDRLSLRQLWRSAASERGDMLCLLLLCRQTLSIEAEGVGGMMMAKVRRHVSTRIELELIHCEERSPFSLPGRGVRSMLLPDVNRRYSPHMEHPFGCASRRSYPLRYCPNECFTNLNRSSHKISVITFSARTLSISGIGLTRLSAPVMNLMCDALVSI